MPENTLSVPMAQGPADGEVKKSSSSSSSPTEQDLLDELNKTREVLKRIKDETERLEEAVAAVAAAATTSTISKPIGIRDKPKGTRTKIPRKPKNHKGWSYTKEDIINLLAEMSDVEDAKDYCSAAQQYMKDAVRESNLDLTQTYESCRDEPEMTAVCKRIRTQFKAFARFEDDWAMRRLIKQYMTNVRDHARKTEKKLKATQRGPGRRPGCEPRERKPVIAISTGEQIDNGPDDDEDEDAQEEKEVLRIIKKEDYDTHWYHDYCVG